MPIEKSLHYYYQHLDPTRISFAREARGLTKKQLAELLDKQPGTVTQLETGNSGLAFETFSALVRALDVHPAFLTDTVMALPSVSLESCHFRVNRKVLKAERLQAICYARQILAVYAFLEQMDIVFPEQAFLPWEGDAPDEREMETQAARMRTSLGLGSGPIPDMARLLENIGVRLVLLPTACAHVGAFASWINGVPCVIISPQACAGHMQFDYGHEFAHLIFDENTVPGDPLAERRASRFASAFLMPEETFGPDCPGAFRRSLFLSISRYWHVQPEAILYRARELGLMQERTYRNAQAVCGRTNECREEPENEEKPLPRLLAQALELVSGEITLPEMAAALGMYPSFLERLLLEQGVPTPLIRSMMPPPQRAKIFRLSAARP